MMRSSWMVTGLLAALAIVGCSSDKKPEAKAPTQATTAAPKRAALTPAQEEAVGKAQQETNSGLSIDDAILKLCPDVRPPQFDYDSSKLKEAFRNTMVALATCMNEGNLRGKDVLLVGHADPRGEEDYNMHLGGNRAQSVRGALQSLSVEPKRLDVTSRGALDAAGTEEASWAKDRRVDIKLKVN